jgi:hypothetical protein
MSEYEACGQYFHVLSYRVMAPNFAPNDRGAGNTASDCFEAGYESNDRDLKKHPPRLAGKNDQI